MDSTDTHLFARFPAPFNDLKEKGKLSLRPLLQNLFDNVDDALFELADRAGHNAEQNMYFESMRELRIKRRGMELGFIREIDENFRQLVVSPEPEVPTLSEVTSSTLSLVGNDELEELVAVDAMVAKSNSRFAKPLANLNAGLESLVGHAVTEKTNPFGPAAVCRAFSEVCAPVELDIKAKLVLYKLFERHVVTQLESVLAACNRVLTDAGVQSRLRRRQAPPIPAGPAASEEPAASEDVFSGLQNLLHQTAMSSGHNQSSGLVSPGMAPAIPRNTLMQLLHAVQQRQLQTQVNRQLLDDVEATIAAYDIQQALNDLLSAKMPGKALSIGQVDDDAINLVAMLFQFILDDRNLATPMKALIARLQIPIIKVAMVDKSFFSKGGHPARKLLNEIATASLGWTPAEHIDRDPLFKKIEEVINRIVNDFDTDADLFQSVLADFIAFLEVDRRRSGLVEQRTIDAEDGRAKSEQARARVGELLARKLEGHQLPPAVVTLLNEAWNNVLFLLSLKEGGEGEEWDNAVKVVDDLLWSVSPMTGSDSRQRLLRMLPNLLKDLRAGLTLIGYNPHDMNQLFDDLEKIHLAQLSGVAPVQATPAPDVATTDQLLTARESSEPETADSADSHVNLADLDAELSAEFGDVDELLSVGEDSAEQPSKTVDTADTVDGQLEGRRAGSSDKSVARASALITDEQCLAKIDRLTMGNWVEVHQDDGKKYRCRLAAVIRGTGKYIFVNRAGMKVAEHSRETLASAMQAGAIVLLDDGLLFDRALESVIGNLRDMKNA